MSKPLHYDLPNLIKILIANKTLSPKEAMYPYVWGLVFQFEFQMCNLSLPSIPLEIEIISVNFIDLFVLTPIPVGNKEHNFMYRESTVIKDHDWTKCNSNPCKCFLAQPHLWSFSFAFILWFISHLSIIIRKGINCTPS